MRKDQEDDGAARLLLHKARSPPMLQVDQISGHLEVFRHGVHVDCGPVIGMRCDIISCPLCVPGFRGREYSEPAGIAPVGICQPQRIAGEFGSLMGPPLLLVAIACAALGAAQQAARRGSEAPAATETPPRTLVAPGYEPSSNGRKQHVRESRSAMGQGGVATLMALHALRRQEAKRCPFVGPRRDKAAHP